jgi:hypothetical protein
MEMGRHQDGPSFGRFLPLYYVVQRSTPKIRIFVV